MSDSTPVIDIRPDHWEIVQKILQKHVPQYAVWAFGSRAKWTAKAFSDLDLVVITDRPLSLAVSASLSEDFCESDLPYKVDVVDWATTSESFRKIIERDKVVVQEGKSLGGVSGWTTTRLGEVADINPEAVGQNWPYLHIRYVDISSVGEGQIESPPQWMNLVDAPSRAKRLVRNGDTVLSTVRPNRRSMFFASRVGDDLVVSTGFAVLRPNINLFDARFLYACVFNNAFTDYLITREKGAAYPAVSTEDIANAEIPFPPLSEQRAIAHILGTLDDKIELNRKQNETLEAMARALFKAWFVDFEPVRAKLQGRWQRGQSLPGLPAHLYDIFPDRLVESELGEIPEGWSVSKVEKLLSRLSAKARYIKEQVSAYGQIPVFEQGASILLGYHNGVASYPASAESPMFIFGDHTCVTRLSFQPFDISQNVIPLQGKDRATAWVYYAIKDKQEFQEYRRHWMELISKDMVIATADICLEFSKRITKLHLQIEANEGQMQSLAALRDTLLPKLISGELRVPDAAAEAAA